MAAPSLVRGRVLLATVPDQNGVNPKRRPVVLLTGSSDTPEGEPLLAVGVTTTFPLPLPRDHVRLPYSGDLRCRAVTGLREESAAVCSWFVNVERSEIEARDVIGIVPPDLVEQIIDRVRQHFAPRSTPPPPPPET